MIRRAFWSAVAWLDDLPLAGFVALCLVVGTVIGMTVGQLL